MPGIGPLPKPRDKRVRQNKDIVPLTVVAVTPTEQPELPGDVDWHPRVRAWWNVWGTHELAVNFTDLEWAYQTDTALVLNRFWNGDMGVAGELRLRAAKFGVTPEDRARLRIQIVVADKAEAEAEATAHRPSSRDRYTTPQAV
jgi:hypothetical protein